LEAGGEDETSTPCSLYAGVKFCTPELLAGTDVEDGAVGKAVRLLLSNARWSEVEKIFDEESANLFVLADAEAPLDAVRLSCERFGV
jgi:hypothetical protein